MAHQWNISGIVDRGRNWRPGPA